MKHNLKYLMLILAVCASHLLTAQMTYLSHGKEHGCGGSDFMFLSGGGSKTLVLPSGNVIALHGGVIGLSVWVKYAPGGVVLSSRRANESMSHFDAELVGDTSIILTGSSMTGLGSRSYYLMSLDTNLNTKWKREASVPYANRLHGTKVCLDSLGNIYVGGTTNMVSTSNMDLMVSKYTPTGTPAWTVWYDLVSNDSLSDIQAISKGTLLVTTRSGHVMKMGTDASVHWTKYPYPQSGKLHRSGNTFFMTNGAKNGAEYITLDTNGVITGGRFVSISTPSVTTRRAEDIFITADGHVGMLIRSIERVPYGTIYGGSGQMYKHRVGILMLRPNGSLIYAREAPLGPPGSCLAYFATSSTLSETRGDFISYNGKRNFYVSFNSHSVGSISSAYTEFGSAGICISDTLVPPSCMTVLTVTGVGPATAFSPSIVSVNGGGIMLTDVAQPPLPTYLHTYTTREPCCISPTATGSMSMSGALGTFSATLSTPLLTAWWDFGDGSSSTGPMATHLYLPGTYTPCFKYSTPCSTFTQCKPAVTVCAAAPPTIVAPPSLHFCMGDSITLTVPPGYPYWAWSTGSTDSSIVLKATQTVVLLVMDAAGCSGADTLTVYRDSYPPLSIFGDSTFCTGDSTMLTLSAFYDHYAWSTGDTLPFIRVKTSGIYSVTVNSATCGDDSASYTVVVKPDTLPIPVITPGPTIGKCAGTAVVLGTTVPYADYAWSPGYSGPTLPVYGFGTFNVTVTTLAGCEGVSAPVVVSDYPIPVATTSPSGTAYLCAGDTLLVTASPGPHYAWSTGDTTNFIHVTSSGTYSVEVTSIHGCEDLSPTLNVIVAPAVPPFSILASGPLEFCEGGLVYLYPSITSASYSWSDGSMAFNNDILTSGTYSLTITNSSGCTGTAPPVTVTVHPTPTPVITSMPSPAVACEGDTVTLFTGGYPAHVWQPSLASTPSINVTTTSTWKVRATSSFGCIGYSPWFPVTFNPLPAVTLSLPFDTVCADGPALTLSGGSPSWGTYSVNGVPGTILNPATSGLGPEMVEYTYTAATGCSNVASQEVWVAGFDSLSFTLASDTLCDVSGPYSLFEGYPPGGTYAGVGVIGTTFDPAAAGPGWVIICYEVSASSSCTEVLCDSMYVDVCTSMQGPASAGWECWPNPVTEGIFHLRGPALQGEIHLTLMDAAGRRVHEQVLGGESLPDQVDIKPRDLAKGIYLLRLTTTDGAEVHHAKILLD